MKHENKVGQRTQKQNGTEQTIFSCMSGTNIKTRRTQKRFFPMRFLLPAFRIHYTSLIANFLSVQHAVSLPPSEALRNYFHCFIPSSIRSRSLPAQLPQAISTASSRRASGLAPSQRSFPKLFPRLHPVEHPVSLPPSAVSPSYFHGFIPSSIRSRSLPAQFPQAISTASSR